MRSTLPTGTAAASQRLPTIAAVIPGTSTTTTRATSTTTSSSSCILLIRLQTLNLSSSPSSPPPPSLPNAHLLNSSSNNLPHSLSRRRRRGSSSSSTTAAARNRGGDKFLVSSNRVCRLSTLGGGICAGEKSHHLKSDNFVGYGNYNSVLLNPVVARPSEGRRRGCTRSSTTVAAAALGPCLDLYSGCEQNLIPWRAGVAARNNRGGDKSLVSSNRVCRLSTLGGGICAEGNSHRLKSDSFVGYGNYKTVLLNSSSNRPHSLSRRRRGSSRSSTTVAAGLGPSLDLYRGCEQSVIPWRAGAAARNRGGDKFLVSSNRVCRFSTLGGGICAEENSHHLKGDNFVGYGNYKSVLLNPVVARPSEGRGKRGRHLVVPALSHLGGGGGGGRKFVHSSRDLYLCGKSRELSGKFGVMELFRPQLMDTIPFRFLPEYHTTPPRAVKDSVSPICFFGFGQAKAVVEVVQAGDPVLHEPAVEVRVEEIGSVYIEKIINDMVATMRNAPGVGLAAPQIGVHLQIIVLEDTKELMSYSSPEECEAQQRFPFDLLVIINPKLKTKKGSGSAVFFEGCLSVEGYRALVERDLEVEVTGLGRDGRPVHVDASGWKARILQHECDHLAGSIYVDKMVPKTFRTKENLRLPLPAGCPKPGVCKHSSKSFKV